MKTSLPNRYLYRLQQTSPGRVCVLTQDCEALALAVGGIYSGGCMVSSNDLHEPVALAAAGSYEPGVKISVSDTWQNAIEAVDSLAELYPGVSEERLREMGFGGDIDRANACRAALSAPAHVTRAEARALSRKAGQHQEPYRGYGHDLKDGRFLACAPDGNFYVRAMEGAKIEKATLAKVLIETGDFSQPHPHGGVQVFYRGVADRRYWDLSDAKVIASLSGPSLHIASCAAAASLFLGSY